MAMPKAPVHEECDVQTREHEIRRSGKVPTMKTVTKTCAVDCVPHSHLRSGVLRVDAGHDRATHFYRYTITHSR
jgi:hypothetical protein